MPKLAVIVTGGLLLAMLALECIFFNNTRSRLEPMPIVTWVYIRLLLAMVVLMSIVWPVAK